MTRRQQDRSVIDSYAWRTRIRPAVAQRAQYRCESCRRYLGLHGDVDHITPRSRCEAEGIDPLDMRNLQYLCTSCHSRKTASEMRDGKPSVDRSAVRRANVRGRGAYLQSLHEELSKPVQLIAPEG